MSRFRRRGARVRWELEAFEVQLLHQLREGLGETLDAEDAADPILRRFLPAAVADDEEADGELRRLIRDDLLENKRRGLEALLDILGRADPRGDRLRVDLQDDEPLLVLGVLNDLRLAMGARLGIEHLDRGELAEDGPEAATLAVMDHLAWIQESLLRILDPASVVDEDPFGPLDGRDDEDPR